MGSKIMAKRVKIPVVPGQSWTALHDFAVKILYGYTYKRCQIASFVKKVSVFSQNHLSNKRHFYSFRRTDQSLVYQNSRTNQPKDY